MSLTLVVASAATEHDAGDVDRVGISGDRRPGRPPDLGRESIPDSTAPPHESRPITVIVADDTPPILEALQELLDDEPELRVVGLATTGVEAVTAVLSLRPDVTVMDMRMPELDGLRAARQILEAWPTAKILIHSAYADQSLVEEAISVGVAGYVVKSQNPYELVDRLLDLANERDVT